MKQTSNQADSKFFRWELAGVGSGPYRFQGIFSFPSPGLAEANITAYNNALAELAMLQKRFGVAGGACDICGMCLTHNYVFRNAEGRNFVVGCDCAGRAGEMTSEILEAKRRHERALETARIRAEHEAKQQAWEAFCREQGWDGFVSLDDFYHTSQQNLRRAEMLRQQQMAREAAAKNRWLLDVLRAMQPYGEFIPAMIQKLQTVYLLELSDRQVTILADIYAKQHGRRNSKAYKAAYDRFYDLAEAAETAGN